MPYNGLSPEDLERIQRQQSGMTQGIPQAPHGMYPTPQQPGMSPTARFPAQGRPPTASFGPPPQGMPQRPMAPRGPDMEQMRRRIMAQSAAAQPQGPPTAAFPPNGNVPMAVTGYGQQNPQAMRDQKVAELQAQLDALGAGKSKEIKDIPKAKDTVTQPEAKKKRSKVKSFDEENEEESSEE